MPTFDSPVNISGPGGPDIAVQSTTQVPPTPHFPNGDPSRVILKAVTSNGTQEGQLQFLGQFALTGIPGTPSNLDSNGPALVYRDNGVLVLFLPHGQPGIVLDPTAGITFPDGSLQRTAVSRTFAGQGDSDIEVQSTTRVPPTTHFPNGDPSRVILRDSRKIREPEWWMMLGRCLQTICPN